MMKTSVVISTFNGMKYIEEQLSSIRDQIVKPDEVLIFDDRSSDGTYDFVKQFIASNNLSGWIVVQNSSNKGWEFNFWDGIQNATGDIIFTCDQDDIWRNDKIAVCRNYMSNPYINLLVSNYYIWTENKQVLGHKLNKDNPHKIIMDDSFFDVKYPGCTYCFKKSFYTQIKDYWKAGYPHDAMLWRYAILCDSLFCINEPLIKWRRHKESTYATESRLSKTLNKKISWIAYSESFVEAMMKFCLENNTTVTYQGYLEKYERWLKKRNNFLANKNIVDGLLLAKDIRLYGRFKRYIGDWYLLLTRR